MHTVGGCGVGLFGPFNISQLYCLAIDQYKLSFKKKKRKEKKFPSIKFMQFVSGLRTGLI